MSEQLWTELRMLAQTHIEVANAEGYSEDDLTRRFAAVALAAAAEIDRLRAEAEARQWVPLDMPDGPGRYWFRGIAGGERYEGTCLVGVAIAGNLCAEGPGESLYGDIKDWSGQWWGPIVAPWDAAPDAAGGEG